MIYPETFKTRVKEAYPDCEILHHMLETGDPRVGNYLERGASFGLSLRTILNATSLEELQNKARDAQKKEELYNTWCRLRHKQKYR